MAVSEILKILREEGKIRKDDSRIAELAAILLKRKFVVLKCGLYWSANIFGTPKSIAEFEYYYLTAKGEEYLFRVMNVE